MKYIRIHKLLILVTFLVYTQRQFCKENNESETKNHVIGLPYMSAHLSDVSGTDQSQERTDAKGKRD